MVISTSRSAGACDSGFYPEAAAQVVGYPASAEAFADPNFTLLLHHYVEVGASVELFVAMLERLPFDRFASVLEIGCGMGVALDYCRVAWGAEAVGVEPSAYGKGGEQLLGLPIIKRRLDKATKLGERTFDLVAAIEVVEHVSDPGALLAAMRQRLAAAGILFVTLPSVEVVTRDSDPAQLYGVLSAGAHWFVPSKCATERLLHECGLAQQRIHTGGGTHVAAASREPVPPFRTPEAVSRARRYLAARVDLGFVDPRVELAFLIHAGDPSEPVQHRIDALLEDVFQISLRHPLAVADRVAAANDLFAFGRAVPYGLPFLLRERAASTPDLAALAAVVCAHGLRVDYQNLARYELLFSETLGLARRAATLRRLNLTGRKLLGSLRRRGSAVPGCVEVYLSPRATRTAEAAEAISPWLVALFDPR